jgi:hypothetical protein
MLSNGREYERSACENDRDRWWTCSNACATDRSRCSTDRMVSCAAASGPSTVLGRRSPVLRRRSTIHGRRSDDPKRLPSTRNLSQTDLDRSKNGCVARRSCRIRSSTDLIRPSPIRRGASPLSCGRLTGPSASRHDQVGTATTRGSSRTRQRLPRPLDAAPRPIHASARPTRVEGRRSESGARRPLAPARPTRAPTGRFAFSPVRPQ